MRLNFWMSWDALLYALKIQSNANACYLQILWGLPSVFNMQCSKPVFQLDMAALCFQKKGLTKWPLIEKDLDCLYMMFQLGQSSILIRFCSTDHIRCASALKIIASDTLCDCLLPWSSNAWFIFSTLGFFELYVQLCGYDFLLPVLKQLLIYGRRWFPIGFLFCSSTSCNQRWICRDCGLQATELWQVASQAASLFCCCKRHLFLSL